MWPSGKEMVERTGIDDALRFAHASTSSRFQRSDRKDPLDLCAAIRVRSLEDSENDMHLTKKRLKEMVERTGIEPVTSWLPAMRSPS